ncbi:MAG: hypothetical protein CSA95_01555 [Bacteroidetes bacterium]|nr:MAG: hypothetical protein CSA95_01555 [Bacteroidota bacterium]
MDIGELLPILLGILWVVLVPILKARKQQKVRSRAVATESQDSNSSERDAAVGDLISELFEFPEEKISTPVEGEDEAILSPRVHEEISVNQFAQKEGVSVFDKEESPNIPSFSLGKQGSYPGALRGDIKGNLRQAMIFSEILRRPYAD